MVVKVSKPEINVREKISELDKPSGIAGQAILAAETPQEQFNLIGAGRRNLIINGAMQVAQRGPNQTSQNASGYLCDRFSQTLSSYGVYTREQSTDAPAGFANSFKLTCTTPDNSPGALDYSRVAYYPEAQDLQLLNYGTADAKDVTISFWVKSNVSATYVFWVFQYDHSPYRHINKPFTIDAADTWEYKTITIEGDTLGQINNDNGAGLIIGWIMSAGTSWTSGTRPATWTDANDADRWVGQTANIGGAANNYFQITGVQLELGKVATPFEHRSYGEELALCQRYFYKVDEAGGQTYNAHIRQTSGNGTQAYAQEINLPVTMRASPSVTVSYLDFHKPGVRFDTINSVSATGSQQSVGLIYNVATADVNSISGQARNLNVTADAEL